MPDILSPKEKPVDNNLPSTLHADEDLIDDAKNTDPDKIIHKKTNQHLGASDCIQDINLDPDDNLTPMENCLSYKEDEDDEEEIKDDDCLDQYSNDEETKNSKKKKIVKRSLKLDAKSKLEKSRQSARECRARKKLRYQYLEDLVCNREKTVMKLREEVSMFCNLSDKIEKGTLTQKEKHMILRSKKE